MVELETMYGAQKWWDKKVESDGNQQMKWADMRIGDRQRVISAYLNDSTGFEKDLSDGTISIND